LLTPDGHFLKQKLLYLNNQFHTPMSFMNQMPIQLVKTFHVVHIWGH